MLIYLFAPGVASDPQQPEEALLERLARYSEPNVKVVRVEKTSEPLGATVKNEGEAVVVSLKLSIIIATAEFVLVTYGIVCKLLALFIREARF